MSAPEIAALDAALDRAGENVTLKRTVKRSGADVVASVTCRAAVRSVSADQIAGTIAVTDLAVIISPTQILAASWPGANDSIPAENLVDQRLPKITDKMVVQGRERQVKVSKPIYVGGEWVRTDMVVAG
ncbi:hypothetical protein [Rhizobium sp. SGZ-381]|uniref:hypothetical protein n=1 Tax=Rhizobium sp. SGZ-381 TaxID=3342800 RepID=UPI00366D7759